MHMNLKEDWEDGGKKRGLIPTIIRAKKKNVKLKLSKKTADL